MINSQRSGSGSDNGQQQSLNYSGPSSAFMPQQAYGVEGGYQDNTHLLELADVAANHGRLTSVASTPVGIGPSGSGHGTMQQGPSRLARHSSTDAGSVAKPHTQRKYGKICTVCGDKALGYNFDAISCESCKAFFRRNAGKMSTLRCAYNDNCQIDKGNRKLCRKCRLKKCFRVGMRVEYIQSEEQKKRKREIVEQNRGHQRKRDSNGSVTSPTSYTSDEDIFPDTNSASSSVGDYVKRRNPSSPGFHGQQNQARNSQSGNRRPRVVQANENVLTASDCQLIDEAVNAWKISLNLHQQSTTPTTVGNGVSSQEDLLNVSEISFRRMVSMFKSIHLFRTLEVDDQKSLLKGGALDLLILRSVLIFNAETQMFLDPTDDPNYYGIRSDDLRRMVDGSIVDGLVKLIEGLKLRMQVDDVMLILLLLVTLFSDDRPELQQRAQVSRIQEGYTTALQHYIATMRATSNGVYNVLFPDLIVKLRELRNLSTTYETVVPFLKQWAIKPLMRELLKLTPPCEEAMMSGNNYMATGNAPPGVDEDLFAAQQLFREHYSMMAPSHSWLDGGEPMQPGSHDGGASDGSAGPMQVDMAQASPGNPSSVNSSLSLLAGDPSYDLPSFKVDLP